MSREAENFFVDSDTLKAVKEILGVEEWLTQLTDAETLTIKKTVDAEAVAIRQQIGGG